MEDNEEFKSEEDIERGQRQLADATARADADIARAQAGVDLEAAAGRTVAQGGRADLAAKPSAVAEFGGVLSRSL